jgi:hypothetical protein
MKTALSGLYLGRSRVPDCQTSIQVMLAATHDDLYGRPAVLADQTRDPEG